MEWEVRVELGLQGRLRGMDELVQAKYALLIEFLEEYGWITLKSDDLTAFVGPVPSLVRPVSFVFHDGKQWTPLWLTEPADNSWVLHDRQPEP